MSQRVRGDGAKPSVGVSRVVVREQVVFGHRHAEERAKLIPSLVLLHDIHHQKLTARHATEHVLVVVHEALRVKMMVPGGRTVCPVAVEEQVLALCAGTELSARARDPRHEVARSHDEASVWVNAE